MKDKWRLEFGDDIEDPAARDRAKINAFRNGCPIILAIFMDEHGWKVRYTDINGKNHEKKLYDFNADKVPYFNLRGKRKKLRDCLFPPVDMYFKSIQS